MKGIIGFLCECRAGLAHHFNYRSSWEHGKSTNTWIPVFCTQALFPMAMLHCCCMKWFPVIPLPLVSTCWICRWRTSGSIYRQQNEVPKSAHGILLWCSLLIFFLCESSASLMSTVSFQNICPSWKLRTEWTVASITERRKKKIKILLFAPRGLLLRINCFCAVITGLMIQKTSRKSNSIVRPPMYAGETYIKYCLSQDLSNLGMLFMLLLLFPSQACFCHKL